MAKIKIRSNPYENTVSFYLEKPGNDDYEPIINENSKLHNEKLEKGVFSFNVKEIVDAIIEEFKVGNDTVFIQFEGTNDEYKELASLCLDDDYKDIIKISKSNHYLRNARDILPEVTRIFDLMQPLISDTVMDEQIEREKRQFKDVTKTDIPLCVLGNYSSGKSTFINALIGHEILPSGDDPLTAKIHRIENSGYDDRASISFEYNGDYVHLIFDEDGLPECEGLSKNDELYMHIYEGIEAFEHDSIVVRVNKALEVINSGENQELMSLVSDMIEVTVPFSRDGIFGTSQHKYVIFDTPGSNAASNRKHFEVLKTAMENLSNGLPIYISSYNSLDSTDNADLCNEINNMKELDSRFTMIVVNKADEANLDKYKESVILGQAIPRQLYSGGIFFVSSIMGLGSKNDGSFNNKFYRKTYRNNKTMFEDPEDEDYLALFNYNIMAEQIKRESVEKSEHFNNRILANSGLYWVEEEIETFAGKYSPYNKCQQSRLFLRKVIQITLAEIERNVADKDEIKKDFEAQLEKDKADVIKSLEETAEKNKNVFSNNYDDKMQPAKKSCYTQITKEELQLREREITEERRDQSEYTTHKKMADDTIRALKEGVGAPLSKEKFSGLADMIRDSREKSSNLKNIQKEIDKEAAGDLLDEVKQSFNSDVIRIQKTLFDASIEYWTVCTEAMKNTLADKVTGSTALTDEKRAEIAEIIMTYDPISFDESADDIFIRGDFEWHAIQLFGFKIFENNKLNISKLVRTYNREMKKGVIGTFDTLKVSHKANFIDWTNALLNKIRENVTDYNPNLSKLVHKIAVQEREIRDLERRRKKIEDYTLEIENKMSWKTYDPEDIEPNDLITE